MKKPNMVSPKTHHLFTNILGIMKQRTIEEVISNLHNRYKCIDNEDFYVEKAETHIVLNWHTFMDKYVNMLRAR